MKKQTLVLSTIALFTLGFAQTADRPDVLAAAHGRGAALSEDGRRGHIDFEAVRVKKDDKSEVKGRIKFEQIANDKGRAVFIGVRMVGELKVTDNKAELAGPAVLETKGENGPVRLEGRAVLMVIDQARPGQNNGDKKDGFRIRFKAKDSDRTFEFGGALREGDFVVFKKQGSGA
ncbi:MAG: hypothetical protein JNM85_01925 [Chthonomonas sp.]|nr:hypothetical protein [Chthonomonas sp.]